MRAGDVVVLFDGAGQQATARVIDAARRAVEVEVGPAAPVDREPRVAVELACALPKGARAEWLFEHGTEVGVQAFRPLRFERSRAGRVDRRERWERLVAAATEQCDRSRLPVVHDDVDLAALVADPALPAERYVAAPGSVQPLGPAKSPRCLLVVGPEGGLSPPELEVLAAAGFAARSLGPLTLRTETAALVGAARLLAELAPDPASH